MEEGSVLGSLEGKGRAAHRGEVHVVFNSEVSPNTNGAFRRAAENVRQC